MIRKVPFFSHSMAPEFLRKEWVANFENCITSNQFINGPSVSQFESEFSQMVGTKFAIGVANGLDGLTIALIAAGIGPGHRVAVPAHTFIATWLAIERVGAEPVGVDVSQDGLINLNEVNKLTDIQAIIPVHMHGKAVDMIELLSWAKKNDVRVIEDVSQAHLAKSGAKFAGSIGDLGVFSLYPTKNLGALGDAGVICTNNSNYAETCRSLTNYGSLVNDKYTHVRIGFNSRLDSIQAEILRNNLKYLEKWTNRRKEIAGKYLNSLSEISEISFQNMDINDSVWHHFAIYVRERERVKDTLLSMGIGTEIHYPNLAAKEYYQMKKNPEINFPSAENIAATTLSLPISQWHTDEDIDYVINEVKEIFSK